MPKQEYPHQFDLDLILKCMAGAMPMMRIGNKLIVFSAVEQVDANDDGSLTLHFLSKRILTLMSHEARDMEAILKATLEQAIAAAKKAEAERKFGINGGKG